MVLNVLITETKNKNKKTLIPMMLSIFGYVMKNNPGVNRITIAPNILILSFI